LEKTAEGVRRFALGLGKKVLIANVLGEFCTAFRGTEQTSVVFTWIYGIAFALQIYFDFSGYSDMAIGLGKFFGFTFMENFNYPFISKSISEFWRRWHISLGSWFRDYVYIPLGGSRVSSVRWVFNFFVVWMLTGLWHGAAWNFVLWGIYFAIMLAVERLLLSRILPKLRGFSHVYVLFFILISFIIFDAPDLASAGRNLLHLFGGVPFITAETLYHVKNYGVILVLAVIGATPLVKNLTKRLPARFLAVAEPIVTTALLLLSTAYLVDGSFNPFLYFRF
jgi:alginate O-acetyltransferase complex protein AlgI